MKILFAIKSLDVAGGGAERVLTMVASGLAARSHDVSVLTFDRPGGTSFYPMDARVRRICLGIGPTGGPTGPRDFVKRVHALRASVRATRPDVLVAFMHSMAVPLSLATIGLGIPRIVSEHIVPEYYHRRRGQYALFLLSCMMSRRVTVLSPAVLRMYPALVRGRMVPVSNPVSTPREADPAAHDSSRTVLAVGRLVDQKDHATLIEAFALLGDRYSDWRLRIVGEGVLRADLERRVAQRGLAGRVELPGTTPRIEDEYANAAMVAVPSRYESFGMVTAEALAAGLPVVGFADCPGTNELIRHDQNGWLVEVPRGAARTAALAAALAKLMNDPARRARLGAAGAQSVADLAPGRVTGVWEQLLAATLRRCPPPAGGL